MSKIIKMFDFQKRRLEDSKLKTYRIEVLTSYYFPPGYVDYENNMLFIELNSSELYQAEVYYVKSDNKKNAIAEMERLNTKHSGIAKIEEVKIEKL